jgi:nuclear transcription factor Y, gamma
MNAAQIAALSQIQAQAIVHARKSKWKKMAELSKETQGAQLASFAAASSPQQIQTQIQLQAQALVHAHTQAQIAAGIYKGEIPSKKDASATMSQASPSAAITPLLTNLTPTQLQQQQALTARQDREKEAMKQRHTTPSIVEQQKKGENAALENAHKQQVQELHKTFRKQNAAAEYAGVKVSTVPNPTASSEAIVSVPNLEPNSDPVVSATSPQFLAKLNGALSGFWAEQFQQVQVLPPSTEQDFKNHNDLPLARIKRIMKSDEDVRMISAEAPVLFAKACELFILELTLRSWNFSQHHKRRTLQKEDIREAIQRTDIFDFLVDVIQ